MADSNTAESLRPATTRAPKEMGPGPAKIAAIPKSIRAASGMDVRTTPVYYAWLIGMRAMSLAMATEYAGAAAQIQARMLSKKRGRWSKSVVSNSDAKKVLKPLHQASGACYEASNRCVMAWKIFGAYFEELRNPSKDSFDYRDNASTSHKATSKG
jgi:hypothetical protein